MKCHYMRVKTQPPTAWKSVNVCHWVTKRGVCARNVIASKKTVMFEFQNQPRLIFAHTAPIQQFRDIVNTIWIQKCCWAWCWSFQRKSLFSGHCGLGEPSWQIAIREFKPVKPVILSFKEHGCSSCCMYYTNLRTITNTWQIQIQLQIQTQI